jgi:hypothetical protein
MAIRAAQFKSAAAIGHRGPVPCQGRISLQSSAAPCRQGRSKTARNAAMIDQQIEIRTQDGHVTRLYRRRLQS